MNQDIEKKDNYKIYDILQLLILPIFAILLYKYISTYRNNISVNCCPLNQSITQDNDIIYYNCSYIKPFVLNVSNNINNIFYKININKEKTEIGKVLTTQSILYITYVDNCHPIAYCVSGTSEPEPEP